MQFREYVKKFDWPLLFLAVAIVCLGVITFHYSGAKSSAIVNRQVIAVAVSLAAMFGVSLIDFRIFKNYSIASLTLYVAAVLLLLIVLGAQAIRGASSWLVFGGFQFQPSEFAKLAVLILLAKYFSQKHSEIHNRRHILASGIYVGIPALLTLAQPDLGSTVVFIALWIGMLLIAGVRRRHLLAILMIGTVLVSFAWFFAFKPYQKDRILAFIDPYIDPRGIGYNTIQAQTTLGSGQVSGTLLSSDKKDLAVLVPEPYTDFVVSAYGQKFGFIGIVVLMGLLVLLFLRIGEIVSRSTNNFAKLFALGYIIIIFVHVTINMGMNLGVLPITGIPFSFLSYGGSHLLTMMAGLGVLQSIKLNS
jgi:rod shape determining protein RodA